MAIVNLYNTAGGFLSTQVEVDAPTYRGGEGSIYISKDKAYAIKIYHEQKSHPEKNRLLEKVRMLGSSLTPVDKQFLCWPIALVHDIDGIERVGCVTPYFGPPYTQLEAYILSRGANRNIRAGKPWATYVQIARGIARSVAALHARGCAHADISPKNFLANFESGDVVLIDLDGLVVPGFLPPQVDGTLGFMAPEVIAGDSIPTERSDRHSLAVLVLHTLLFRNVMKPQLCYDAEDDRNDEKIGFGKEAMFSEHPNDQRNYLPKIGQPLTKGGFLSYKILTPSIQKLTERALIERLREPNKRPSAREWSNALSCSIDELSRCSKCELYFFYPHWKPKQRRTCPFCGEHATSPFPSVLRLYEPRTEGKYTIVPQRYLVLGDGWHLFSDILSLAQIPPISRKNEPRFGHIEWDRKRSINQLINDEGGIWKARLPGTEAPINANKGAAIPLQPSSVISFGEGRRLLFVQE